MSGKPDVSDSAASLSRLSIARADVMLAMQPCIEGPRLLVGDFSDSRVIAYYVDAEKLTKLIEAAGDVCDAKS